MSENNERQGLPSASDAERWMPCSGSHLAQQAYPNESSDASERGDLLHEITIGLILGISKAGRLFATLSKDDKGAVVSAIENHDKVLEQWKGIFSSTAEIEVTSEKRRWIDGVLSGKYDLKYKCGPWALLIDFKFGRVLVQPAPNNKQMQVYAILEKRNDVDIYKIRVAVIQIPPMDKPFITQADYGMTELRKADLFTVNRAQAAMEEDADRTPGNHCKYCKDVKCNKRIQWAIKTTAEPTPATPTDREFLLVRIKTAQKILTDTEAFLKKGLIEDPSYIEGWEIKEKKAAAKVPDIQAFFTQFKKIGGTAKEFAEGSTISIKKFEAPMKRISGVSSLDKAREEFEEEFADLIVRGEPQKELKQKR